MRSDLAAFANALFRPNYRIEPKTYSAVPKLRNMADGRNLNGFRCNKINGFKLEQYVQSS